MQHNFSLFAIAKLFKYTSRSKNMTHTMPTSHRMLPIDFISQRVFSSLCALAFVLVILFSFGASGANSQETKPKNANQSSAKSLRFATFNVAMNRKKEGQLATELGQAKTKKPQQIAEIIQRIRPDVILLNEFDRDEKGEGIEAFQRILSQSQNGQTPIKYPYHFAGPVNTGVPSKLDLNGDGKVEGPQDAFGFGDFPGQYAMVVFSKYKIDVDNVRTFQRFLWKDMPGALIPKKPESDQSYYSKPVLNHFRLSSKSHWIVPIKFQSQTIHFLAAHPTPPVFDGPEDRNGKRNHDEIRMLADLCDPTKSQYLYDDKRLHGGLKKDAFFVIAGDMNADPEDGDSTNDAIRQLLNHPLIQNRKTPASVGASKAAKEQGGVNEKQKGNPKFDTSDFFDGAVGNLRIDYVLPSKTLEFKKSGVFWPTSNLEVAKLIQASDHRLVWIDVSLPKSK